MAALAATMVGLGAAIGCVAAATQAEVKVRTVDKRQFAAAEFDEKLAAIPAQVTVFERAGDWAAFCGKLGVQPPAIDFAREAVVAAFAGQKPTSGYSITIARITYATAEKRLRIRVVETAPPPGAVGLQALTYPFAVVAFTRPGEWTAVDIERSP